MLNHIVGFSLGHRIVILALGIIVIAYGLYVATRTRLDVFPEFAPPQVIVQTEAPGLSSEEVEQLITLPIETELNGTPSLQVIRSESIQGLSVVTLVFRGGTDIFRARQMVTERLGDVISRLPQNVGPPRMGPLTSSTSLSLVLGLSSTNRTPMELRSFADWTFRPYLLSVPGVAKVDTFGGDIRQFQVQVKPDALQRYGLSLDQVLAAARLATGVRGAGYAESANQRIVIHTVGQSLTPQALGQIVLEPHPGLSVRLSDVADVREAAAPKFGDSQFNGQSGVVLLVYSQFQANTMVVTRALEAALEQMKPALATERIALDARLFRPANFIETSLRNVNSSLLIGGALVAVVLFLFLLDLRTAFISFISIPLSLLTAVIVLDWSGVSINTITLGGFAIAIGVVVDDAIIDVENILRRLRENSTSPHPRSLFEVVLGASLEVRSAVVYATFIVAMVFVPILTMSGVQGRLFSPLGVSFILATLASLAVALTVTPALCYVILAKVSPHEEPRYVRWLKERHRRWLESVSHRPRTLDLHSAGRLSWLCRDAPVLWRRVSTRISGGHTSCTWSRSRELPWLSPCVWGSGSSPNCSRTGISARYRREVGRAENGEDTFGPHYSELHVDLAPLEGDEAEAAESEIRNALAKFPGVSFKVMSFLAERMEETISGTTAEFVIDIFGNNLDLLDQKAEEARQVLAMSSGAVDVNIEAQPGLPELTVSLRPERLLQFGFQPVEVLEAIQTGFQGAIVSQIYEGNRVWDVAVVLDPPAARNQKPSAPSSCVMPTGLPSRCANWPISLHQWALQRDSRGSPTVAAGKLQCGRA